MTQINLYKIHEDERELFIKSIARKYRICAQKILDGMVYRLFIQYSDEQKDVSWKWAFDLFETHPLMVSAAPKGMLLIERQRPACLYVITFGSAYFDVDAYPLLHPLYPRDLQATRLRRRDARVEMIL